MPKEKLITETTSAKFDDWFSDLYEYLIQFLKTIVYFSWFPVKYILSKDKKSFFLNNSASSINHVFYIFVSLFVFSWFVNLAIFRKVNNLPSETIDFSYKYFVSIDIAGKIFLTIPTFLVIGLMIEIISIILKGLIKNRGSLMNFRKLLYFLLATALFLYQSVELGLMFAPDFQMKGELGILSIKVYTGSLAFVFLWHYFVTLSFSNSSNENLPSNSGKGWIGKIGEFTRKAFIFIFFILITYTIYSVFIYTPTISRKSFEIFFKHIEDLKVKPEVDFQGLEKKDTLVFDLRNIRDKGVISTGVLCINQSSGSVLLNNCNLFQVYFSESIAEKMFLNFQIPDCVEGFDSTHLELESGRLLRQTVISRIDSSNVTDILKQLEKAKRVFVSVQYLPRPDVSSRLPIDMIIRQ